MRYKCGVNQLEKCSDVVANAVLPQTSDNAAADPQNVLQMKHGHKRGARIAENANFASRKGDIANLAAERLVMQETC